MAAIAAARRAHPEVPPCKDPTNIRSTARTFPASSIHFVGKVPHEVLTELMQVVAVYAYRAYPLVLSWSLMDAVIGRCIPVAMHSFSTAARKHGATSERRSGMLKSPATGLFNWN